MGRHRKTHFWTGATVKNQFDKDDAVLLCGENPFAVTKTQEPKAVTCPDCSKKLAWALIAARPADAPALELVKNDTVIASYYRYTYEVKLGGEHVGYIGMEGAYGKGRWFVSIISTQDKDDDIIRMGYQVEETYNGSTGKEFTRKLEYASKEAALADIPRLVELKLLKSAIQTVQDAKDWRIEKARRLENWEKIEAVDKQQRVDTISGLLEIKTAHEAGTVALSNYQIEAVVNAIALLRKEGQ